VKLRFALMCNSVCQQNILVLYNQHHKQSKHVSHTDDVDQSLQGPFIPLVLFTVPTSGTTTQPKRVFTTTGLQPDELSTPSNWLFAVNEDCTTGAWCWCINTDELLSSVKLYPYCRLLAWLLAAQWMSIRALMSVVELCRLPTVFHTIWKAVFA